MSAPLLQVQDLVVDFKTRAGNARVLDHVSLDVSEGKILGIVGESGCGKSMTALSIMGLVPNPPGNSATAWHWRMNINLRVKKYLKLISFLSS